MLNYKDQNPIAIKSVILQNKRAIINIGTF